MKRIGNGFKPRCHPSTTLSIASVIAPASGPKSSTHVNANISDGARYAETDGTLRGMRPATTVSTMNTSSCAGTPSLTSRNTQYTPSGTPTAATTEMYARAAEGSGPGEGVLTRAYRQPSGIDPPHTT